jgi:adenylate cyclase
MPYWPRPTRTSSRGRRELARESDVPEIERKFTIDEVPDGLLEGPWSAIRQGYLSIEPVEVRIRSYDGDSQELTLKSLGGLSRTEVNVPLTADQFEDLWLLVERVVEKTRHDVELGGHTVEIDSYRGKLEGLVVAEVEFSTEREAADFAPPPWFGTEVTDDKRYRNAALAAADAPPPDKPPSGA